MKLLTTATHSVRRKAHHHHHWSSRRTPASCLGMSGVVRGMGWQGFAYRLKKASIQSSLQHDDGVLKHGPHHVKTCTPSTTKVVISNQKAYKKRAMNVSCSHSSLAVEASSALVTSTWGIHHEDDAHLGAMPGCAMLFASRPFSTDGYRLGL